VPVGVRIPPPVPYYTGVKYMNYKTVEPVIKSLISIALFYLSIKILVPIITFKGILGILSFCMAYELSKGDK